MAIVLINRMLSQEVRFPNPETARQYADQFGGGLSHWDIAVAGAARPATTPTTGRGRRAW